MPQGRCKMIFVIVIFRKRSKCLTFSHYLRFMIIIFNFILSVKVSLLLGIIPFKNSSIVLVISQHPMFRFNHGLVLIKDRFKFILNRIIPVKESQVSVIVNNSIIIFRVALSVVNGDIPQSLTIVEDIGLLILLDHRIQLICYLLRTLLIVLPY